MCYPAVEGGGAVTALITFDLKFNGYCVLPLDPSLKYLRPVHLHSSGE